MKSGTMKTVLITGCNRGLGLGLVKEFLRAPSAPLKLVATCRDLQKAQELADLAKENKNLHILTLDVTKTDTHENFLKQVSDVVGDDGLNVLFNNAGYSPKFTRLGLVKPEQLLEAFQINTVGPIMLTKALLPLLQQAATKNSDKPLGSSRAVVVNMTTILGSIASNNDGGFYPYRCSKAALNMATKSMSVDLKKDGILATCIHPGWVQTDMGGANAPMDVHSSTSSIVKVVYELEEKHNGAFIQYNGETLPW